MFSTSKDFQQSVKTVQHTRYMHDIPFQIHRYDLWEFEYLMLNFQTAVLQCGVYANYSVGTYLLLLVKCLFFSCTFQVAGLRYLNLRLS